jgi:hypothetical protein
MGSIFGGTPDPIEAPPVPEPAPIPVVQDEAQEFAVQEERARSGISKTFLTGNLSPSSTGKKKKFGGN